MENVSLCNKIRIKHEKTDVNIYFVSVFPDGR